MIHITPRLRPVLGAAVMLAGVAGVASAAQAADYQQYRLATCANKACRVNFGVVPAGKTLHATRASCYIRMTNASGPIVLNAMQILLIAKSGETAMAESMPMRLMAQFTPAGSSALTNVYEDNESILIAATAGQHLQAFADVPSGDVSLMACHVSGTLTP